MEKNEKVLVTDIMTKGGITVLPETSLLDVSRILAEHNFDGVPVVDGANKLVGIITEYDLISKSSSLHLPTLQKVLQNLLIFEKDRPHLKEEIGILSSLKAADVMNNDPLYFREDTTYEEAVMIFREHHRVNPVPVVDSQERVVGVVSRFDVLKPFYLLMGRPQGKRDSE